MIPQYGVYLPTMIPQPQTVQGNISNYIKFSPLPAQSLNYQPQPLIPFQSNITPGVIGMMPTQIQQQQIQQQQQQIQQQQMQIQQQQKQQQQLMINQTSQNNNNSNNNGTMFYYPSMVNQNGFYGIPIYAAQSSQCFMQGGMVQTPIPYINQPFLQNNQIALTQNQQFNQQSQPSLQKMFGEGNNNEQKMDQQQSDNLQIPSLMHIGGMNNSQNNAVPANVTLCRDFSNSDTLLLNSQFTNNNQQVKIESNEKDNQLQSNQISLITNKHNQKSPQNNKTNKCIQMSTSSVNETTSFKLTKNSSSSATETVKKNIDFTNKKIISEGAKSDQMNYQSEIENSQTNDSSFKEKSNAKKQIKMILLPSGQTNNSTSIMTEQNNLSQKISQQDEQEQLCRENTQESVDEDCSIEQELQQNKRSRSTKSDEQKKKNKSAQNNQQKQQNKIIKEELLGKASPAERELLNQVQQISKQNSAKAFLKAYKKFALQDQPYIYNYEINENQYYYKVCRDMPITRIDNPNKKDLEGFYRKFKKFFNGKQYNNNTLKIIVKNKLYGKLFNDFLEEHSDKWLNESKCQNKDGLRIIIKFLQMCHTNLNYLVFLRDHEKSKDKSQSGYDSD